MFTPSPEIIQLLEFFSCRMTAPSFAHAVILICGTILAPGRRTVASALRMTGHAHEQNFSKYHRLLSRARWSAMSISHLLLLQLLDAFVPEDAPIVIAGDETLERRRGKRIRYKGWYRDAVRSSSSHVATSLGIRWLCLCLQVTVPWSSRPWALPFLTVPVLSGKTCDKLKRRHRSGIEWTIALLTKIRNWLPNRKIVFIGDGAYAVISLVASCQKQGICLVSRMRSDAALYDAPKAQPAGKRGPKPKKGDRLPSPKMLWDDPSILWQSATVSWYGGRTKEVQLATGQCLWAVQGYDPVNIRWVLVKPQDGDPEKFANALLFSSEVTLTPAQIVSYFAGRWNIEVFFEEVRAHLGFETQRQWSRRAIGRITPCLFGIFSIVVLIAKHLGFQKDQRRQEAAWYTKDDATFSDVLAWVRTRLWNLKQYECLSKQDDMCLIPKQIFKILHEAACYAA